MGSRQDEESSERLYDFLCDVRMRLLRIARSGDAQKFLRAFGYRALDIDSCSEEAGVGLFYRLAIRKRSAEQGEVPQAGINYLQFMFGAHLEPVGPEYEINPDEYICLRLMLPITDEEWNMYA